MSCLAREIDTAPDGRRQPRTHLFVAATLYAGSSSSPVNIRNMSPAGALIEGAVLPDVGERMLLRRGELQSAGFIAWRAGRKAGVRLEAEIYVADWMARQVHNGQERVDAIIAMARNAEPSVTPIAAGDAATLSVDAELGLLRTELANLENSLIGDAIVVATHPEIQTLDISLQRIDRIMKRLRAGG